MEKLNALALVYPDRKQEWKDFLDDDIREAQAYFASQHRNHHKNFGIVLEERANARKQSTQAHKYYREVGIGYTATIITLCILQPKYFHDVFASGSLYFEWFGLDITDGIKLSGVTSFLVN